MASASLYEKILHRIEEGAPSPEMRPPRSSASVVLWRRRSGELELFWIKRSENLRFMGGFHAFPGGGLSRRDPGIEVEGRPMAVDGAPSAAALPEAVTDGIEDLGPILPAGLVCCALRELYEETGLLLSPALTRAASSRELVARVERGRRRLLAKEADFAALLDQLGLRLDATELVYAGRWLTPPLGPLRFDNRFFLLEWPAQRLQQPLVVQGEAESGEWITPERALARWRQGEIVTAPPILHILEVMAQDGPEAGLGRLQEPVEANLGAHRRIEFRPGVLLFPVKTPTLPPASFTNAYVLGCGEVVLVDPGSSSQQEIERLISAVQELDARLGRRVTAIWLSHHHPDHIGGVGALRHALDVPVRAHRFTAERLAKVGLTVDEELQDGQTVVLDGDPPFSVRIFHTPGHARGHLCFFDERHGSLLSGDLVAGFGTIVIDPPEGNMEAYLTSLRRMRDLEPTALFPAHGPPTKNAVAKLEEYCRHRLWRERRVLKAWRAGCRQPAEMVAVVYDDIPAIARPLAERQIVAHLERLRDSGRLSS